MKSNITKLALSTSLVALLAACAVTPVPLSPADMKAQAVADRTEMFTAEAAIDKPLALSDAIARALAYNLDRRTKVMEEALALGQKNIDRWDLLPKLAANAGYSGRTEPNATRSRGLYTQTTSANEPTYSTDRDSITADLGLSWNVLDFGVSYVTAHQNADRALIASERRRKTVHNLVQEVRFAFWRTAAAQVLEAEVRAAVTAAETALADARRVEKEGLKAPAEMLRYQKNLLENLRQLEAVSQELSTARLELAALINLPPGSEIRLEVPSDSAMTPPVFDLPVERMEELAFVNNADLREQAYLSRIAVDETRKTILKLLPGINFTASRQYDSNSFLIDNRWFEAGAKVSWNLMNLLSAPDQIDNAEAGEKVANARRVALRMAVLAQVHVAYRQFLNAGYQYQRADQLYSVEQRLARFTSVRAANDAQSVLEDIANRTSAIAAKLRRYQTYALVHSALGRLHATIGQDLMPEQVASHDLDAMSRVIAQRLDAWSRGEVEGGEVDGGETVGADAPEPVPTESSSQPAAATAETDTPPPAPTPEAVATLASPPVAVAPPPAASAPVAVAPAPAPAPVVAAPPPTSAPVQTMVAAPPADSWNLDAMFQHISSLVAASGSNAAKGTMVGR